MSQTLYGQVRNERIPVDMEMVISVERDFGPCEVVKPIVVNTSFK